MSDARLRAELAEIARALHASGWVANHEGNVTARLGVDRFLATPTGVSKRRISADSLIVVDGAGKALGGRGRPFSELGLHLAIYRRRRDVQAVVHAHPPTATGFALAGVDLLARPFSAEAVVSLGPSIPTVPFAPPGPSAVSGLEPYLLHHDVVLLEAHGALAWGDDLEQAYLRMEHVEQLARTALVAAQLGAAPRALHPDVVTALLDARRRAGLGPEARGVAATPPSSPRTAAPAAAPRPKVVVACAPPPPGSDVVLAGAGPPRAAAPSAPPAELAAIIRQELARALRDEP